MRTSFKVRVNHLDVFRFRNKKDAMDFAQETAACIDQPEVEVFQLDSEDGPINKTNRIWSDM